MGALGAIGQLVDGEVEILSQTSFRQLGKSEADLEAVLAANPALMGLSSRHIGISGKRVAFKQLQLPTGRDSVIKPDIVFLTEAGHVVVVEVKLSDNPELTSRAVVSQVLDYASALSRLTDVELARLFAPLDSAPGASFHAVVATMFPDTQDVDDLADEFLERIRQAQLHLVIACDGAPRGLLEHVRGVASQAALGEFELSVVEVVPFVSNKDRSKVLLQPATRMQTEIVARTSISLTMNEGSERPLLVVKTDSAEKVEKATSRVRQGLTAETDPVLAAAVNEYNREPAAGLNTYGSGWNYRQLRPRSWPELLHYEFFCNPDGRFGVELHLEGAATAHLSDFVVGLGSRLQAQRPSEFASLEVSAKRPKRRGYLRFLFDPSDATTPVRAAVAMRSLIEATVSEIGAQVTASQSQASQG